jgi:Tfp pilus assembly protein PilN
MRAVNLIPVDERRGGGRSSSGIGSYIILGVLALVVAVGASTALANRSISHRRAELTDVKVRTKASADEVQALQAYTSFSALRKKRDGTIRSLAGSRFDWAKALHEVARTMPSDAWLTGLRATVTPSAAVDGGVTDPLRGSVPSPAIEIVGCTTSQDRVAAVISSLRRADGVQRVSLSSSEKLADGGAAKGEGVSGGGEDCRNGDGRFPKFSVTLFFTAPAQTAAPTQTTTQGKTP